MRLHNLPLLVKIFFVLTEEAYSRGTTPDKEVWPNPISVSMGDYILTNVSTSPDLYIEFSTECIRLG